MHGFDDMSGMKSIAGELYVLLADAMTMSFRAQSAHWNVKGPDFHQYHAFFAMIYEDVYGSVDAVAENIRKLGFEAPLNLMDICETTMIPQQQCSCDPSSLTASLNAANEVVIARLNSLFTAATMMNAQAIADFAASRLDMHEKWRWQMSASLGVDGNVGKSPADLLVDGQLHSGHDIVMLADGGSQSRDLVYPDKVEFALTQMMDAHNRTSSPQKQVAFDHVKAVYRRGAMAHMQSGDSPRESFDLAGMRRVSEYLSAVKSGPSSKMSSAADKDLLPSSRGGNSSVTASAARARAELAVTLVPSEEYSSPDEAVFALAEFSGRGYDMIPRLRAAWKRGVDASESGYERAKDLAIRLYDSKDADLLPKNS